MIEALAQFIVPRPLTWVFVAPMLAFAVFATLSVRRMTKSLPGELTKLSDEYRNKTNSKKFNENLSPKEYLLLSTKTNHLRELAEMAPGIFVTMGILGTFVGLGLAVTDAAQAMAAPEQALPALQGLLQNVGFKFQASVAGILLSLLYSLFVLRPFHKVIEQQIEEAALALTPAFAPPTARLATAMEKNQQAMGRLLDVLPTEVKTLSQAATDMAGLSSAIKTSLDNVAKTIANSVKESAETQAHAGRALGLTVSTAVADAQKAQAEQATTARDHLIKATGQQSEQIGAAMRKLDATIASIAQTLDSSVKASAETQQQSSRELADMVSRAVGAAQAAQNTAAVEARQLLASSSEKQARQIATAIDKVDATVQNVNQAIVALTRTTGEITAVVENSMRESKNQLAELSAVLKHLKDILAAHNRTQFETGPPGATPTSAQPASPNRTAARRRPNDDDDDGAGPASRSRVKLDDVT